MNLGEHTLVILAAYKKVNESYTCGIQEDFSFYSLFHPIFTCFIPKDYNVDLVYFVGCSYMEL
jgi:hypothetical protein